MLIKNNKKELDTEIRKKLRAVEYNSSGTQNLILLHKAILC